MKEIFVIPWTVGLKRFYPRNISVLRRRFDLESSVVGYIGRLAGKKGIIDFVRSLFILSRKGIKFRFLIVGNGPHQKRIRRTINNLGLNGLIKIIPAVPHNEIWKYYNCIDISVVPSHTTKSWKEQFGCVLIEAMACEVPVIVSSSGEIPNIIRKTGGRLIFQERNIENLAAKLCELLKDEKKRKELGQKGRE